MKSGHFAAVFVETPQKQQFLRRYQDFFGAVLVPTKLYIFDKTLGQFHVVLVATKVYIF